MAGVARHGELAYHLVAAAAARVGAAPSSVETRYRQGLRALDEEIGFELSETQIEAIARASDFLDAYERLRALGPVPVFALVERVLWRTSSLGLVAVRVAERTRRQVAAESARCPVCAARARKAA